MNKKRKEPEFIYPFRDAEDEASRKMWDMTRTKYVSKRGTQVSLVETLYNAKYRKVVLTETVYIKVGGPEQRLGEILTLRPYDQVRRKKLIFLEGSIDRKGSLRLEKNNVIGKVAEFNPNETRLIMFFYEHREVPLVKVPRELGYTTETSVRSALIKINREISGALGSHKSFKLVSGDQGKGYSFNPDIRLDIVDASDPR
jgi:hypothetical protein